MPHCFAVARLLAVGRDELSELSCPTLSQPLPLVFRPDIVVRTGSVTDSALKTRNARLPMRTFTCTYMVQCETVLANLRSGC